MNRVFKIVVRDSKTQLQIKKRVYTSKEDYDKYKDDIIYSWVTWCKWVVELYEKVNNKWILIGGAK